MTTRRTPSYIILILLCITATLPAATIAAPGQHAEEKSASGGDSVAHATTATNTIHLDYTVSYLADSDRFKVTVRVNPPSSVTGFKFIKKSAPDNIHVKQMDGFTETDTAYKWDTSSPTPRLTYTVPADQQSRYGRATVGTDAWSFVYLEKTDMRFRYQYTGTNPGWEEHLKVKGTGFAGVKLGILGGYSTHTVDANQQTFRFIVPDAVSFSAEKRQTVANTLATASNTLYIGDRDSTVNVFVVGDPMRGGGLTPFAEQNGQQDFWVHVSEDVNSSRNAWLHEYIHARQSFNSDTEMQWVTEGSADYYAALLSLYQGRTSFQEFHNRMTAASEDTTTTLSKPKTWTESAQYAKGRLVVAALDAKIRRATNGKKTFADVMSRVNHQSGQLTYSEFTRIINDVAGTSMSEWLDTYVAGHRVPTVPSNASLYAGAGTADPDSDGLSNTEEDTYGTDVFNADSDGDGLTDDLEVSTGTDPVSADTDNDGVRDGVEVNRHSSDPLAQDTDGDGAPDGEEVRALQTNPTEPDSDEDGLKDGVESEHGADPTAADTDQDGLSDGVEVSFGSSPTETDTDGDHVTDSAEKQYGTAPSDSDSDGDGVKDAHEIQVGADPTVGDSDADGVADGVEVGSDRLDVGASDTDSDGYPDKVEVSVGSNPGSNTHQVVFWVFKLLPF